MVGLTHFMKNPEIYHTWTFMRHFFSSLKILYHFSEEIKILECFLILFSRHIECSFVNQSLM